MPAPPAAESDNRAFWEAYFSNFIEGTEFTVEEARSIIYSNAGASGLTHNRPEDAHDVRETHRLIIDKILGPAIPADATELLDLLKRRHARMMAARPATNPGVFKTRNNQVGPRVFVAPGLVEETLSRGWQLSRSLPSPTGRAFFILFLLAEVHPFNDGNGRISRLGMNAELDAASQARLIIPTAFREDYISALRALTLQGSLEPFIRFSHKLVELNSRMPFRSFDGSHDYFRHSKALIENDASLNLDSLALRLSTTTG